MDQTGRYDKPNLVEIMRVMFIWRAWDRWSFPVRAKYVRQMRDACHAGYEKCLDWLDHYEDA
jgi:hypothetical protein